MALAQPLAIGTDCFNCLRLAGEHHRMVVYENCYHCPNCKNTLPTRAERGRIAIGDNLRLAGFALLLLATMIFNSMPVYPHSLFVWLMLFAGYSFFGLTTFNRTREMLHFG